MRDGASLHLWTETDGSVHYSVDIGAGGGSAHCSVYEDHTPILGLWQAGVNVTVWPGNDTRVTDAELQFAKDLAAMAADYLSACRRFHTPDAPDADDLDRAGDAESKPGQVACTPGGAAGRWKLPAAPFLSSSLHAAREGFHHA